MTGIWNNMCVRRMLVLVWIVVLLVRSTRDFWLKVSLHFIKTAFTFNAANKSDWFVLNVFSGRVYFADSLVYKLIKLNIISFLYMQLFLISMLLYLNYSIKLNYSFFFNYFSTTLTCLISCFKFVKSCIYSASAMQWTKIEY